MSIPVLTSIATLVKAPSGGAAGGSTASSGSEPAGAFAAVLQSSLESNDTLAPVPTGDAEHDNVVYAVDGMDQIVVHVMFTQAPPSAGASVTSSGHVDAEGDAGLTDADATATDAAALGAIDRTASTVPADPAVASPSTAATSLPAGPQAGTPSDNTGLGGGVPLVPPLPNAGPLSTPAASATVPAGAAIAAAKIAITYSDGSMMRAGHRRGEAMSSTVIPTATAVPTTAPMVEMDATAAAAAPGTPGAMNIATTAAPSALQASSTKSAGRDAAVAAIASAAPAAQAAPATAMPGVASADLFATALGAINPLAVEPVAGANPAAAPPTLPAGLVPPHQAAQTTPAAPAASVAPAQPVPLTPQVAAPLFTLMGAKPGEHVLTINVTPDNLGPVTVRAHVSVDSVRVELFAPNDAGRDALRAILPDLRRDLAGSGLNANLDLSSQNQASDSETAGREALHDRRALQGETAAEQPAGTARPRAFGSSSTIDVLA